MRRGEQKQKRREYYQKNKERIKERIKEYYWKNKERIKEYYWKNKERIKERIKEYYWKNKEKIGKYCKEYKQRPEVIERRKEYDKKRRHNPKRQEYRRKYRKEYKQRPEVKERRNFHLKDKRKKDIHYKILTTLRARLTIAFKDYSTTGKHSTSKKYGIDYKAIIEHLKPFPKDIENYHIDHIIPLSKFDFNKPEHIKIAFAPENHQWLTMEENLKKGNRLIMPYN